MYNLVLLSQAQRDMIDLDPQVARRIAQRLQWLAENFEQIKPESLSGEMSDFLKFRVGDYRVLYKSIHTGKTLRIYRVRHRREIYKEK